MELRKKSAWFMVVFIVQFYLCGEEEILRDIEVLKAQAQWRSCEKIAWELPGSAASLRALQYWLYSGQPVLYQDGKLLGEDKVELPWSGYQDSAVLLSTEALRERIPQLLQGHLVVAALDSSGAIRFAASTQNGGVIDALFRYDGDDLGVSWKDNKPALKLWAPTARRVKLHLFATSTASQPESVCEMKREAQGVWAIDGESSWRQKFYLYEVEVFVLSTGKIEHNLVTDPYSLSLATNSKRSQIVDLNDTALKPPGWDKLRKPALEAFADIVIYELHVRDFSIHDQSVPEAYRGRYLAFAQKDSLGMRHLSGLAQAGLTHVHLLPVFDIATIEENRAAQILPDIPAGLPADSPLPQEIITKVRAQDGFNWGYDPYHYLAPEGSYASDPDGTARICELRQMVQGLNQAGLRVIMDVVFNHTSACGQADTSVLCKIVPGYYYRLDKNGKVPTTSCCPDTASEHAMMEKLMIDAVVSWARHYKIDGFRFDLMGHHTKGNMQRIRRALDALTPEKDGVDGTKIYLYGEGWRFGSLHDSQPTEAFNQANAYGYGIGTFNDRLRDSARGGNFSQDTKSDQGFINGLYYDYNQDPANSDTPKDFGQQKARLFNGMDNIKIGLAANLRDYVILNAAGKSVKGGEIVYRGTPGAGYTASPQECINYVSAHDNYTLWDHLAGKAPFRTPGREPGTASAEERMRMQWLGMSLVVLAQGIPFLDSGIDMLRSKSGDDDSYDSGDWFNRLDFTYNSNNWGVGLPPAWRNKAAWEFWKPRLTDSNLQPSRDLIVASVRYLRTLLSIRTSSRLFRLRTAEEIMQRVSFLDPKEGTEPIPGFIAMAISDKIAGGPVLDPDRQWLVCFWNATRSPVMFSHPALQNTPLQLHPALTAEVDPLVREAMCDKDIGTAVIPPRSTIVYYEARENRGK